MLLLVINWLNIFFLCKDSRYFIFIDLASFATPSAAKFAANRVCLFDILKREASSLAVSMAVDPAWVEDWVKSEKARKSGTIGMAISFATPSTAKFAADHIQPILVAIHNQ